MIASRENKIFKLVKGLSRKKGREESGLFLAEGARLSAEAVTAGRAKFLIVAEDYDGDVSAAIPAYEFSTRLFSEITETLSPQGVLAVCAMSDPLASQNLLALNDSFVVICDKISDPGNLGTIIRTAEATGVDSVILTSGCADPFNPKTVRATMGSIFRVPVRSSEAIQDLKMSGFRIMATTLDGAEDLYRTDLSGKIAVVLGSEAHGVSTDLLALADVKIKIPMSGTVESLNVASAAAVVLYERKRRSLGI